MANGEDVIPRHNVATKIQDGKVVLQFHQPVREIVFDPDNAALIGKHLLDLAAECGAHVELKVKRPEITREGRDKLVNRATQVYRSMVEKQRAPKDIAREVVDSILSAIE